METQVKGRSILAKTLSKEASAWKQPGLGRSYVCNQAGVGGPESLNATPSGKLRCTKPGRHGAASLYKARQAELCRRF